MSWTSLRLRRLVQSTVSGVWGEESGAGDVDVKCVRATDFDYPRLTVCPQNLPTRSVSYRDLRTRQLDVGDLVLEKSGGGDNQPVGRVVRWDLDALAVTSNFAARIRPTKGTSARFLAYLMASLYSSGITKRSIKQTTGIQNLDLSSYLDEQVDVPAEAEQELIADFLDAETARVEALIANKIRIVSLLEERIDNRISQEIGNSTIVDSKSGSPAMPISKLLAKMERPPAPNGPMITAFRDGQVTARALRRAEGYTQSWTENSTVQGVHEGDIVIHGLDGFAGAIGVSEIDGICSPVYHVCELNKEGDPLYLGQMLRFLAISGYLGLYASSTRERAVDFRNWDMFGRIPIPSVHPSEQREIGDSIRKVAPLKRAVEKSTRLARERLNALITMAVTGRLNIPKVKP